MAETQIFEPKFALSILRTNPILRLYAGLVEAGVAGFGEVNRTLYPTLRLK